MNTRCRSSILVFRDLSFSYRSDLVLRNVNLDLYTGDMVALLGPNGSGKTTLLKLASGVLRPLHGEVCLGHEPVCRIPRKRAAREMAVVPQRFHIPFAFTVYEVVMLGRTSFTSSIFARNGRDRCIVLYALRLVGMEDLGNRRFNELSGGEQQKAILAMALAQETSILLLDEPTAHLDINHQFEILDLVRRLNRDRGTTVVAAMHDLNLSSLFFDRLVLMKDGAIYSDGSPAQVLTGQNIRDVFSASVTVSTHPTAPVPQVSINPDAGLASSGTRTNPYYTAGA